MVCAEMRLEGTALSGTADRSRVKTFKVQKVRPTLTP